VRTYAEAARCPHTLERDMLQEVAQEDGKLAPITGPAAKFSRTPTRIRSGAPALGADTENILAELGIDADARKRLRESGVV
jgi:formyl-CoA transferase